MLYHLVLGQDFYLALLKVLETRAYSNPESLPRYVPQGDEFRKGIKRHLKQKWVENLKTMYILGLETHLEFRYNYKEIKKLAISNTDDAVFHWLKRHSSKVNYTIQNQSRPSKKLSNHWNS